MEYLQARLPPKKRSAGDMWSQFCPCAMPAGSRSPSNDSAGLSSADSDKDALLSTQVAASRFPRISNYAKLGTSSVRARPARPMTPIRTSGLSGRSGPQLGSSVMLAPTLAATHRRPTPAPRRSDVELALHNPLTQPPGSVILPRQPDPSKPPRVTRVSVSKVAMFPASHSLTPRVVPQAWLQSVALRPARISVVSTTSSRYRSATPRFSQAVLLNRSMNSTDGSLSARFSTSMSTFRSAAAAPPQVRVIEGGARLRSISISRPRLSAGLTATVSSLATSQATNQDLANDARQKEATSSLALPRELTARSARSGGA